LLIIVAGIGSRGSRTVGGVGNDIICGGGSGGGGAITI
jgi:hypothetical protein